MRSYLVLGLLLISCGQVSEAGTGWDCEYDGADSYSMGCNKAPPETPHTPFYECMTQCVPTLLGSHNLRTAQDFCRYQCIKMGYTP